MDALSLHIVAIGMLALACFKTLLQEHLPILALSLCANAAHSEFVVWLILRRRQHYVVWREAWMTALQAHVAVVAVNCSEWLGALLQA